MTSSESLKITFLLLLITSSFLSCQKLIYTVYGGKSPNKYRSEEKIRDFSSDIGLDTNHLCSIDSSGLKDISILAKKLFPNVMIFDSKGMYVPNSYDDSTGCTVSISDFIGMLGNENFPQPVSTNEFILEKQLKNLRTLNGDVVNFSNNSKSDYFVLIFTGYFMGKKINEKNTLQWQSLMEEEGNKRFSYATVFVDRLDWWKEQYDE